MDQTIIDTVKAKHPTASLRRLHCAEFEEPIDLLVKVPDDAEWKRFRAMQEEEGGGGTAASLRTLAFAHVVYPEPSEFAAKAARFPGLPESVAKQLVKLAGASIPLKVEKV